MNCENMNGCYWVDGHDADCSWADSVDDHGAMCCGDSSSKMSMCSNSMSMNNCENMNGCYWVDGHDAMCCGDSSSKMSMCSNSMSMNNCDGMNGCHWVTVASDCAMEEQMFFAGHGIEE